MSAVWLDQVSSLALALPGVERRMSHRAPCFYVRNRAFCRFHDASFGNDRRVAIWCLSSEAVAADMVEAEPSRFFQPTPSASGTFANWLGIYLDTKGSDAADWGEIASILEEAYRLGLNRL